MASGVTLPTFEDEEILLYEKLNSAMSAINAKFLAGIGTSDLQWPLTAEGDLNMSIYNITGGKKIWNYINAANYADLDAALDAAGSGDVVLVPPDTTLTTAGGKTFSGAAVIGAGPSSVIKYTAAPSAGFLIQVTSGDGVMFADLTFDGNVSSPGTGQNCLDLKNLTNVTVSRCYFKDFSGACLEISGTTDGVMIDTCTFSDGDAEHIYLIQTGQITISNCLSDGCGGIGLRIETIGGGVQCAVVNTIITGWTNYGIRARGQAGSAPTDDNSVVSLHLSNVVVDGTGATNAIEAGGSTTSLRSFTMTGGRVNGSSGGGIVVNASAGHVTGVEVVSPTSFCVDLDESQYVSVSDCTLRSSLIGIDGSGCGGACYASNNVFVSCTTDMVLGANFYPYNNPGALSTTGEMAMFNITSESVLGTGAAGVLTMTIPAYTLKVGSVIAYDALFYPAGSLVHTGQVRLNNVSIGGGSMTGSSSLEHRVSGLLVVDTATTGDYQYTFVKDGVTGGTGTSYGTGAAIDITSDMDIEVYITPNGSSTGGDGVVVRQLIVRIMQGREYT